MATENLLVLIHGITTDPEPRDHSEEYRRLREGLDRRQPRLGSVFDDRHTIAVEWGHELPRNVQPLPDDQEITRAENALRDRVAHEKVRAAGPVVSRLFAGLTAFPAPLLRRVTLPIKENVLLLGMTDVLYYCSPDGERAVRRAVYTRFLDGMEPLCSADQVRLHVIAQSLGVTVAFDFLFGLFAPASEYPAEGEFPEGTPGFVRENRDRPGMEKAVEAYEYWRERAQRKTLLLASKSSTGGQLPLMMMRKQKLVEKLFRAGPGETPLDPEVIGVPKKGALRWKIFYDVDDVLGFPAGALFQSEGTIQDLEVDTGAWPDRAHRGYWESDRVLTEIAGLIVENLG